MVSIYNNLLITVVGSAGEGEVVIQMRSVGYMGTVEL